MTLIHPNERDVVHAIAALIDCNPFLPERVALEQRALGAAFVPTAPVWHAGGPDDGRPEPANPNAAPLRELVERLGKELRRRLSSGTRTTPAERADYQRLVLYRLFQRYEDTWYALIAAAENASAESKHRLATFARGGKNARRATPKRTPPSVECKDAYQRFAADVAYFFDLPASDGWPEPVEAAHLFALGFQARRAFHYIYRQIFGGSLAAALLRAAVWQAIFTHDMADYRSALYARMRDIPVLITGESGTGKELVARAIAQSGYIPFNAPTYRFAQPAGTGFFAVNLAALSPTLIESELFGHCRGAFTGALGDRLGWFEACGPHGAVFIDEVGEIAAEVQVKLLRVMQTREFQRVGETEPRLFAGKIIAATHRQLKQEIAAGRFREDLYYRIRGHVIRTPTLREQLAQQPADLLHVLPILARRIVGPAKAAKKADEAARWIAAHLGPEYPWPGNIRELEQCVGNVTVSGEYEPEHVVAPTGDTIAALAARLTDCGLTADELLQCYCATIQARTGNYGETARRLQLDPRTVRAKVTAWVRRGGGMTT